jgi:predicted lipid-binding transport protein (Tim44 family)
VPADLIIYAAIAAGLVFWLRNILGTRHGDERSRENPFLTGGDDNTPPDNSVAGHGAQPGAFPLGHAEVPQEVLPRNASILPQARAGLEDIARVEKQFDIAHFLGGAETAFIMIVEAFAKGDKETLQNLLSDPVYKLFNTVIDDRAKKGEMVDTEIHAVRKIEVMDARLVQKTAYLTIEFTADETCVIRDKDNNILSGDPDRITEMRDIWVFSRTLKSKDPVWYLVETRDGEVEEHKTPLPDSAN